MGKRNLLGVVGLGRMGGPLAQRLTQAKFPLMVWDTVSACRKPFENKSNIRVAAPGAMARECSESARLADRMGMRVADMIDVFNVSTAYSYASRHRFPNNILNGSWNAQARIYNPWKDVGLAVRLARKCGADVEFGERTFAFLEKAVARGMIEQDYSLLYRDFEKIRKIKRNQPK